MKFNFFKNTRGLFQKTISNRDKQKPFKQVDNWLALVIILLVIFGIIMVYNSSVAIGVRDFSDQFYYIKEQLRGLSIGLFLFGICTFINYKHWQKLALPLVIVNIILLLLVFVPGIGISALGAHRWIRIFGTVIQPAELAKFTLIIYLSSWLSQKENTKIFPFLLIVGIFTGLVMIEPDMGTSIVLIVISLIIYFCAGTPVWHLFVIAPIAIISGAIMALAAPYRFSRLLTFLNPDRDPSGASYQITQALLAIGSGGIFGVGLGMSRQKYEYLPEANTDSIFAVIAEETGLIGSVILLLLFYIIVWRGIRIARLAPDNFSRLFAIGLVAWIGLQAALNIGAMMSLMPLTGIPLPLISYGSSSLVILLTALGILLNISRYTEIK
jgi:cell division protein FtsW